MTPLGHLPDGVPHPASLYALAWFRTWEAEHIGQAAQFREAFASVALSGNLLGEVCSETWRRIDAGETVSDRYLLGLVMAIRNLVDESRWTQ